MIDYPPRLELARLPTPITLISRFALPAGSPRVWIKRDEMTGTEVSGNKIRKLEFSLAQAKADGCDVIITCGGLQSNHCRATAILCARLGLKIHLILRGQPHGPLDGNLLLDHLVGAKVTYLPEFEYRRHGALAKELAKQYGAQGHRAFFIPTGASDEIGLWGYLAACQELKHDFTRLGINPEYVVTATGSGGTQAGLIIGSHVFELDAKAIAFNVCDDEQYFTTKVRSDFRLWYERYSGLLHKPIDVESLLIETIDGYVGPGYAQADPCIFTLIQEMARSEGIFLDPVYTGKAFYGLLEEIKTGRFAHCHDIVFIHTGGVFGLFPQKDQFVFSTESMG
jgi:D-cysteine desulfhydrase